MVLVRAALAAIILWLGAAGAQASLFNPAPTLFGPDNGAQVFAFGPGPGVALKIAGAGTLALIGLDPPNSTALLFVTTDPGGTLAIVSPTTGQVFDASLVQRSTFTPGSTVFAFALDLGGSIGLLTTVDALNAGGTRVTGVFPSLTDPDLFLLGFGIASAGTLSPIAYFVLDGLVAVFGVPGPGALWLFLSGIAGFAAMGRLRSL
jgi:hypothetical protein